jgi:hypothetical protein
MECFSVPGINSIVFWRLAFKDAQQCHSVISTNIMDSIVPQGCTLGRRYLSSEIL